MDCVICGKSAHALKRAADKQTVDCPECGIFEARGDFCESYQVEADGMRQILMMQRQAGIGLPVISGQSAFVLYLLSRVRLSDESGMPS